MNDGRAYPHNLDAERALLGGLLQDPEQLDTVGDRITADDFYRGEHGALFGLLCEMKQSGKTIDLLLVGEKIHTSEHPDQYGGLQYLSELPEHAPSTANLDSYVELIKAKSAQRSFLQITERSIRESYTEAEEPGLLIERTVADLLNVNADGEDDGPQQIAKILDEEMLRIDAIVPNADGVSGTSTGFSALDKILSGLHPSDLVILAARPGMGKTALALNIAQNAAFSAGIGVAIFSLEMPRGQLVTRMLCSVGEVKSELIRTGQITSEPEAYQRLFVAEQQLRQLNITIDDTSAISIGRLSARVRRLKRQNPNLELVVIDYIQLMGSDTPRQNRQEQISEISRGLKSLAKDAKVTVLALSQLNRGVEQRADKRPMISDLRESGAIEQDADIILFVYRDEYYNKEESPDPGLAEIIIAKHRNGALDTVKLVFQGQYTRFFDHLADNAL